MKTHGWPDGEIYHPPVRRRGTYISIGPFVAKPTRTVYPKSLPKQKVKTPPVSLPLAAELILREHPIHREPDGILDVAAVILKRFVKFQHRNGKFAYALKEIPGVLLFRHCCYSAAQRKVQNIIRRNAK